MSEKNYKRLKELQKQYPDLTFNNIGYQYLGKKVRELHREQVEEIESILREEIEGFVRFDNFKPRPNDTFDVRCQYNWDPLGTNFIGVGYFNIEEFKDNNDE